MLPTRQVVARISVDRNRERPATRVPFLDEPSRAPDLPPPLPRPGAADRICDAVRRWLEEDM
jgi:hypothetical protein